MNKLKAKDLIVDQIYYSSHYATGTTGKFEIIWKCGITAPSTTNFKLNGALYVTEKSITKLGYISADAKEELRLATEEEKQWLEACISANKYIPKEEALKPIEMTKEQLLEKANKDYPIGTKYKSTDTLHEKEIKGVIKYYSNKYNEYLTDGWGGYIYYGTKWAEIISKPEVKVKEQLVQTSMSQKKACDTCKYNRNCHEAPHHNVYNSKIICPANDGQHYPKVENIKVDDFVLPEKWAVKVDKLNKQTLLDYAKPKFKRDWVNSNTMIGYLTSESRDGSHQYWGNLDYLNNYKEITFDQFKKYVLKENIETKSEVVDNSVYTLKQIEDALSIFDKEDRKDILDAIKKIK